jgi:oligoribonuclease
MIDLKGPPTKLLWIDLETTGLEPAKDRILEVACIVTDLDFNNLGQYESAVYQGDEVLNNMTEWPTKQHTQSGLIDKVRMAPKEKVVERAVAKFIKDNFDGRVTIAGNTVYYDRMFIRQWWPDVEKLLHYRIFDVSSFKMLMQAKYQLIYTKKESHTALSDIQESIDELKFYLKYFKKK